MMVAGPRQSQAVEAALLSWCAEALEARPEELVLQPVGAGKFNTSWFVGRRGAAARHVLRLAPPHRPADLLFYEQRMMRQEPEIHRRVRAEADCPVPAILDHAWDRPVHGEARDLLLMERLPGSPIGDPTRGGEEAEPAAMEALGAALRSVHDRILGPAHGYAGAHRPAPTAGSWLEAFPILWDRLLADIEGCGGYDRAEADALRRLLDSAAPAFAERNEPPRLLHMDVWAENILVDDGGRFSGLIDWDRALYGDPEIEYAVLAYCGVDTDAFWSGYGADAGLRRRLGLEGGAPDRAWRIRLGFYLLYEMQKYILIRIRRSDDPAGASAFRHRCREQARQLASDLKGR